MTGQSTRNRSRVVITISGGAVQGVIADSEEVDVLIKDYDVENHDGRETLPRDANGDEFNAITGPEAVDPALVNETFGQVRKVYG